jgi:chorismate lyase
MTCLHALIVAFYGRLLPVYETRLAFNFEVFVSGKYGLWCTFRVVPDSVVPRVWQSWILERGSLTKRLIKASHGNFRVRIVKQQWQVPDLSERLVLGLKSRERALIREVELLCAEQVWVRARSIIPNATLTGEERQLANLGTRPLGAFLFSSRTMRRGQLELSAYQDRDLGQIYGRRSVFYLQNKPLLVSEYFMPNVLTGLNG